jgi:Ni/Co efflux regulator RcnB
MLKALTPAAVATILAALSMTAASAAPPMAQLKTTMQANSVQVQFNEQRHAGRQAWDHRYTPGRRYNSAPSHYRRYAHRPSDWRSRGCILVGPVWFCA